MAAALEGIRVIDLTVWFQGPVAAQHLADFGAEVIHVERPKGGDQGRGVRSIKALPVGDWNQYFLVINRNKKSLAVDLKQEKGREILYRLVEKSDVFLSNVGTDNLAAWGLTYDALRAVNPRLVYAITSGYGRWATASKPAFDMTVQALTGLMSRLGEPGAAADLSGDGIRGRLRGPARGTRHPGGAPAATPTGRGQVVDASLYGAQLLLAAPTMQAYLATRRRALRASASRRTPDNPLWNTYAASDRWLFLCVPNEDASFARLRRALGDPPLRTTSFRVAARAAGARGRAGGGAGFRLRGARARDWTGRLRAEGLAASPIGTLRDAAEDPQAWANDYLLDTYCDEVKRQVNVRGLPVGLSKTPGRVESLGPELGQDTELLLADLLGYSWDEIDALKTGKVIP